MKTQEELVNAFAQSMKDELKANEHKGDWRTWKDIDDIDRDLEYHLYKLKVAMGRGDGKPIKEHLADCGNFLLMLGNAHDLY